MIELKTDLLTSDNTKVLVEESITHNAPHNFQVVKSGSDETILEVHFQEGPVKEHGLNGVFNEDLIAMVICRLEYFQNSEYRCRENACAIKKLEEALMWLRKRNLNRTNRGIIGTSEV